MNCPGPPPLPAGVMFDADTGERARADVDPIAGKVRESGNVAGANGLEAFGRALRVARATSPPVTAHISPKALQLQNGTGELTDTLANSTRLGQPVALS